MSYMEPAWQVTYVVEGRDAEGMLTSWRWEGKLSSERYELRAPTDADPTSTMGRVLVTSWQPYKKDALDDCHRAVLDLCGHQRPSPQSPPDDRPPNGHDWNRLF